MTRVECLYRVSTKGQVDHDDIPMQRIECRKFAEQQGWNIIKELCEKGVSGFKISADDRDAIQELREDAMNQRFDVLLVFMFDRLGRRDDETPFVVEWFAKQGIRIFSVKEGEQKFESHTDSLINYIRYWQSEGESRKTSMRIKTRLDQMRGEGLYTGGTPRYGYRAVEKGRRNKKDKPVKDLEICPEEAAVVKEIFERTVYEGAGSFILATELSARGVRTHHGAQFNVSTINKILRDRQYLGYLITQDITSPHLPELQIIDEALFNAAQEITEQRKTQNAAWRNIPRQNCSGVLLGGNLYCAACGSRMTSSSPGEGAKRPYAEYICYMGANHRIACSGQKAYVAKRVDDLVLRVTGMLLNTIQDTPKDESIEKRVLAEVKDLERQLADTRKQADEAAKAQEALEMEVSRCLMGQSQFTAEMLSKLIEQAAQKHKALNHTAAELEQKLADRLSFESAMLRLGGKVLGFPDAGVSSASKGETVADTIRIISCYADIAAMRHPKEGAPLRASLYSKIPVINAGDGGHSHPTQTLLDMMTIRRRKGRLDNLTIGFCGDLKFGRTVHSLIKSLARYDNVKFVLISPEELRVPDYIINEVLEPRGIPYIETRNLEGALPDLDILYMTRVQRERFFNEEDYIRLRDSYILTAEKLNLAPADMAVLHPLPRVNEITLDVDDDPRAAYFEQAQNGVYVRMALIMTLLGLKDPKTGEVAFEC